MGKMLEISPLVDMEVEYLVKAGVYRSKEAVVQDALKTLMLNHPDYKLEVAIGAYQDEEISLGKAAQLAGFTYEEMKEILAQRGIKLKLGSSTKKEAEQEIKVLEELFSGDHNR